MGAGPASVGIVVASPMKSCVLRTCAGAVPFCRPHPARDAARTRNAAVEMRFMESLKEYGRSGAGTNRARMAHLPKG